MRTAMQQIGRATASALALGAVACLAPGCHILAGFDDLEVRGGELGWSLRFGDDRDQEITAVAVDDWGNVVIAGHFAGRIDLGGGALQPEAGTSDLFVAKISPEGTHLWSRVFGTDNDEETVASVAVDAQGAVAVAGQFRGSLSIPTDQDPCDGPSEALCSYVLKLDAEHGQRIWGIGFQAQATAETATPTIAIRDIATDNLAGGTGDVVFVGELAGRLAWNDGSVSAERSRSVLVGKLDGEAGAQEWASVFGNDFDQRAESVAVVRTSGDIAVAGQFSGAIDFADIHHVAVHVDTFVALLSSSGQEQWCNTFGSANVVMHGPRVAMDYLGGMALTGYYAGELTLDQDDPLPGEQNHDLFAARFNQVGDHRWGKRGNLGQPAPCTSMTACGLPPLSIATDDSQSLVVAGSFRNSLEFDGSSLSTAGNYNAFVVKHNAVGDLVWALGFGGSEGESGAHVAVVPSTGHVYLAGSFTAAIDLGNGPLQSAGGKDVFLARFNP